MKLRDLFQPGRLGLSFELFPPKNAAAEQSMFENVETLLQSEPDFFTCTYGAGGSTREKTLDVCEGVKSRFGSPVATHLTCVGSTVEQLRGYLAESSKRGIDYVVALRGDPPKGETSFRPVEGGLRYANELVELIRRDFPDFGVIVAGYPEKHLEAPSMEVDLQNLKRKVDAGADVIVTQLFYQNDDFYRFREDCERMGMTVPIVPGILPVISLSQIQRIAGLCGAKLPASFIEGLTRCGDDAEAQIEVGIEFATKQTQELIEQGIPGVHFYVLNRSPATSAVLRNLGLDSKQSRMASA